MLSLHQVSSLDASNGSHWFLRTTSKCNTCRHIGTLLKPMADVTKSPNTTKNYLSYSTKMSNVLRIKTNSHWIYVEAKAKIFFDAWSLLLPLSLGVNRSSNQICVKSYRPKKAETVTMCCPAGHASITCPDPSHICTRSTCSVHPNINRLNTGIKTDSQGCYSYLDNECHR